MIQKLSSVTELQYQSELLCGMMGFVYIIVYIISYYVYIFAGQDLVLKYFDDSARLRVTDKTFEPNNS